MNARTSVWFFAASFAASAVACGSSNGSEAPPPGAGSDASTSPGGDASTSSEAGPRSDANTGAIDAGISGEAGPATASAIKHVLVIIGENRTFDHVFATYAPKAGQTVANLLSKGIVTATGAPGANFALATQKTAVAGSTYSISPGTKTAYTTLPPPIVGGPSKPYISTVAEAQQDENGLDPAYYTYLTTGGTGLKSGNVDTRVPDASSLPPGPFQLTPGVAYDDYANSPVHRFYQMWQELDCSTATASASNPSGCGADLFPWVETSIGAGNDGAKPPTPFTTASTGEGSTAMGFYNVQQGDVPYFKSLADTYSMSDNFHQSIMGGTGANHIALGTGDAIWFSDGSGNPAVPPSLDIEDPDEQSGTDNWYKQDGYSGGSYTECADATQPGVASITGYLGALHVNPNCDPQHYYILNNYDPGYFGDGTVNSGQFVVPPSPVRTIADELIERGISWRYYGDNWNAYVGDPEGDEPGNEYCNICNPFQYSTSIMTSASVRATNLKDTADLYTDLQNGYLPAFAIVKPSGLVDGHPASSKLDLFEGFAKKIIDLVGESPALFAETAIIVTFDEGGGFYDSGYVQPLDYFGDGTRIPAIVVSPHATGGYVNHTYSDHVSILKFVERNWGLSPITSRSRDNLPNPVATTGNPYVPTNGPAIGDLWDMFDFGRQ